MVTGTRAEARLVADVVQGAGLGRHADLSGRTDLAHLSLVADARLVVSGDTGVAHIASAYARPSVVLFGPASPRIWGPPGRPQHFAVWHGSRERDVLTDVPDPALLAVTVDEVLDAATRAVAAGSPAPTTGAA